MVAWETVAFAMAIRYSRGDLAGTDVCAQCHGCMQEKSRQFLFQFTMSESRFAGFGPNFGGVVRCHLWGLTWFNQSWMLAQNEIK